MKIGILKADNVRPELAATHGEYPDMFMRLFEKVNEEVAFTIYDVMQFQYPESLDEVDAYLITGSASSAYAQVDWILTLGRFIQELDREKKKTIGICFGHQLIAHFLGGETVKSAYGWHIGTNSHTLNPGSSMLVTQIRDFKLPFSHQDQVIVPAKESKTIAHTAACPIAMTIKGEHIFSVQGHPEFDTEYARALINSRKTIFDPAIYEAGISSLKDANDRVLVARWILDFIAKNSSK